VAENAVAVGDRPRIRQRFGLVEVARVATAAKCLGEARNDV
jgi:hypothetical protein